MTRPVCTVTGSSSGVGAGTPDATEPLDDRATDPEMAKRLWDDSARMVGLEP